MLSFYLQRRLSPGYTKRILPCNPTGDWATPDERYRQDFYCAGWDSGAGY